jgi:hypothetical protein
MRGQRGSPDIGRRPVHTDEIARRDVRSLSRGGVTRAFGRQVQARTARSGAMKMIRTRRALRCEGRRMNLHAVARGWS